MVGESETVTFLHREQLLVSLDSGTVPLSVEESLSAQARMEYVPAGEKVMLLVAEALAPASSTGIDTPA